MSTMAEEFPSTPASVAGTIGFSDVQISTLSNGVKVVSKETGSAAVAVGVSMAAGSKYGSKGEALLLKNLAFKGTATRSDIKLARDLENAGVSVAADAGRDTVLLSASGVPGASILEVGLGACAEAPKLSGWHVDEVKAGSVAAELKAASADPMRLLVDKLHEAAYGEGSAMGSAYYEKPTADAADLAAYLAAHGGAGSLTVVGAGGVSHADLVAAAEAALGSKAGGGAAGSAPEAAFVGGVAKLKAESPLTHVAVALPGAAAGTPAYFDALVLKECLAAGAAQCGGAAFSVSYASTGLVGLYGACPPSAAGQLTESFAAVLKAPPSDAAVAAAKLAVKTQLAVAAEDATGLLAALANGTASAGVDAVTPASVKALAAAARKGSPALATVGPAAAVPSHSALAAML